jgi:transcriptional regulator with XRE-family HTH domain
MARLKRPELFAEAARRNAQLMAALGGELRRGRTARRITQDQLGDRIGLSQSTISKMERGRGGSLSMDAWQRAFAAVDRPLHLAPARDPLEETVDAGHLGLQELVIRLGRGGGYRALFELPTKPGDPRRSVDVGLRDDRNRRLLLCELWNTFGDVGAAARSTNRKLAEAAQLAAAIWGEAPHTVVACWIVRATRRNRELVARYPELFASRFPGSSVGWVHALTNGIEPPSEPGLVWADVAATRLFAWRRR